MKTPELWILSAEYGLISADTPVELYDRQMTGERAAELRPLVRDTVAARWDPKRHTDVFVHAAGHYMSALEDSWSLLKSGAKYHCAEGSMGGKLSQLRDWLYGAEDTLGPLSAPPRQGGLIKLRGEEIKVTTVEEAMERARRGLADDEPQVRNFQSWYVPVGSERVSPKWLVSKLARDLPVQRFRTADALKVLRWLGVEVRRVRTLSAPGVREGSG